MTAGEACDGWDPARLCQARRLAGLTRHQVAHEVRVSPATVGQWEAGIRPPDAAQIAALSRSLEVPRAFFLAGRPSIRVDAATVHFRSLRGSTTRQRDRAVAFVEQLAELIHAVERRVELPPVDVPGLAHGERTSEQLPRDPAEAARFLRSVWGMRPGPVPHLVRTMEGHGVVVWCGLFAGEDTARVDAFSTSHPPRPVVMTTPERVAEASLHRFTVAHELGHLVLHHDVEPGAVQQEREAELFAAELLLPAGEVVRSLPRPLRLEAVRAAARLWGVSASMLVRRWWQLGVVTEAAARRADQDCRAHAASGGSEVVAPGNGEAPAMLPNALERAERHGLLTLDTLAEDLGWDPRHTRLLLNGGVARPRLQLIS